MKFRRKVEEKVKDGRKVTEIAKVRKKESWRGREKLSRKHGNPTDFAVQTRTF